MLLDDDVPEPELDPEPAVALAGDRTRDQPLGMEQPPVGEARLRLERAGVLDEGRGIDRPEQARALEVGRDHLGDVLPHLGLGAAAAGEGGDRDRDRLDDTAGDVDVKIGAGRRREGHDQQGGQSGQGGDAAAGGLRDGSHQSMSFRLSMLSP